ncbi:hypothetical protein AALP_AA8G022400 [Arabis alpina]|uniref:DUF7870 domain-containing protein n=1 Tax=Arabis alpina TaxID=50452 RepID=A0A087G4G7_ARAAL|nr:hypothetical protein AALP_AA8G022400 [Arabis alpina]
MGLKILKFNIFRGSTNRHALFRALIIISALSIVPLMELLPRTEVIAKSLARFAFQYQEVVITDLVERNVPYIGKSQLPRDCESLETNGPYIGFIEPLLEQKPVDFPKSVAYLPKFLDLSLKKRLVYIDIGAGEYLDVKLTPNWFFPLYPIERNAFDVYFVDHNTSVMISYVKKPGVTFVYHPGLADENSKRTKFEQLEPFPEDEGFDFFAWFVETAKCAEFVVLKINTSQVEMKFLSVLLETGAICYVDELFLRCSSQKPDCINTIETLRSRGVFVHQWWED